MLSSSWASRWPCGPRNRRTCQPLGLGWLGCGVMDALEKVGMKFQATSEDQNTPRCHVGELAVCIVLGNSSARGPNSRFQVARSANLAAMPEQSKEDALIEFGNTFGVRFGSALKQHSDAQHQGAIVEPSPIPSHCRAFDVSERGVNARIELKPDAINAVPTELSIVVSQRHEFGPSGLDEEQQRGAAAVGFDVEYENGTTTLREQGEEESAWDTGSLPKYLFELMESYRRDPDSI